LKKDAQKPAEAKSEEDLEES
jgi:hypothetical protein